MKISEKLKGQSFTNSREVYEAFKSILAVSDENDRMKEHFWCAGLDTRNRIQYIELVSLGTLTSSLVHPREVFRLAINKNVASILCVHNHPSGDCNPSKDDITITKRLAEGGKILGIGLLDHLIISDNDYLSLMENGYLS